MCLDELMPPSNGSESQSPTRLSRKTWSRSNDGSSTIHLPWTKTKQFAGDFVYLLTQTPIRSYHSPRTSPGDAPKFPPPLRISLSLQGHRTHYGQRPIYENLQWTMVVQRPPPHLRPFVQNRRHHLSPQSRELFTDHAANIDWVDFAVE